MLSTSNRNRAQSLAFFRLLMLRTRRCVLGSTLRIARFFKCLLVLSRQLHRLQGLGFNIQARRAEATEKCPNRILQFETISRTKIAAETEASERARFAATCPDMLVSKADPIITLPGSIRCFIGPCNPFDNIFLFPLA